MSSPPLRFPKIIEYVDASDFKTDLSGEDNDIEVAAIEPSPFGIEFIKDFERQIHSKYGLLEVIL
jgi:hypothetical protein